jgi:hypothetical protein
MSYQCQLSCADPDQDDGRLLTIAWLWGPVASLSLVREISYDRGTKQLVSNPIDE